MERLDEIIERILCSDPYGHRPTGPTHEASRRVLGRRRAVATGAADRHDRRKRARLRHRGDGRSWADGARPSQGDRWTLMAVRHPDICGRALPGRSADDGARRPRQPATSSACSFDSNRTERTASTCSAGRNSSACSSTATGATWSATAVGDPSGPTPSTRRSGKRTSSPSWTTGRSSTRSCRSRRRILVRRTAPARPTSRRRCRPATGGGFLNDDAPVASHGPDGSIPSLAARPLTRQATSGSWERGGHEPRPRAPAASRPSHERPGGRVPRPCRLAT